MANSSGKIFELEGFAAVGMAADALVPLTVDRTIPLPFGSELLFLPDRKPVLFNLETRQIETVAENPYHPGEAIWPVAAFNSPGYVLAYACAYQENRHAGALPLFSYGAVGWHRGGFRTAAIQVDRERRQDLRLMPLEKITAGVRRMQKQMPENRLRRHLETCALKYSCPAAKNFFIGRCEAPLPTSRYCNARCLGCISLQKNNAISNCQERIAFTPSSREISEIALCHIRRVKKSVVSFGQGCEGDPLLAADVIEPAIRRIRAASSDGTINMNTNASRPDILDRLFTAGLDSIRVSMNSVRESCYKAYFRPNGYRFSDVTDSIDTARRHQKFISMNYLNCPGFTDSPEELNALIAFIHKHPVDLIQWRNLNFDPARYVRIMAKSARQGDPIGMETVLKKLKQAFPKIKFGYFNPPKEAFKSN